jgi:hypothetical protein
MSIAADASSSLPKISSVHFDVGAALAASATAASMT